MLGKWKGKKIATVQPVFNFSLENRIQYIFWEHELFIETSHKTSTWHSGYRPSILIKEAWIKSTSAWPTKTPIVPPPQRADPVP